MMGDDDSINNQGADTQRKLNFVAQFMGLLSKKLELLPRDYQRALIDNLEALFFDAQENGETNVSDADIMGLFEDHRREAFIEQVRRAIGPKLSELSQRQKDLLDGSLSDLFKEERQVSDAEIEGRLEMITEHISPRAYEYLQKVYWDMRLGKYVETDE